MKAKLNKTPGVEGTVSTDFSTSNYPLQISSFWESQYWYPPRCIQLLGKDINLFADVLSLISAVHPIAHDVIFRILAQYLSTSNSGEREKLLGAFIHRVHEKTALAQANESLSDFPELIGSPGVIKVPAKIMIAVNHFINHPSLFKESDGSVFDSWNYLKTALKDPFDAHVNSVLAMYQNPPSWHNLEPIMLDSQSMLICFLEKEIDESESELFVEYPLTINSRQTKKCNYPPRTVDLYEEEMKLFGDFLALIASVSPVAHKFVFRLLNQYLLSAKNNNKQKLLQVLTIRVRQSTIQAHKDGFPADLKPLVDASGVLTIPGSVMLAMSHFIHKKKMFYASDGLVCDFWNHLKTTLRAPIQAHTAEVQKKHPKFKSSKVVIPSASFDVFNLIDALKMLPQKESPDNSLLSIKQPLIVKCKSNSTDWYPYDQTKLYSKEISSFAGVLALIAAVSPTAKYFIFCMLDYHLQNTLKPSGARLTQTLIETVRERTLVAQKGSDPSEFSDLLDSPGVLKIPGKVLMALKQFISKKEAFRAADGLVYDFWIHLQNTMREPFSQHIKLMLDRYPAYVPRHKIAPAKLSLSDMYNTLNRVPKRTIAYKSPFFPNGSRLTIFTKIQKRRSWYPPQKLTLNVEEMKLIADYLALITAISPVANDFVFRALEHQVAPSRKGASLRALKLLVERVLERSHLVQKGDNKKQFEHLFGAPEVISVPGKLMIVLSHIFNRKLMFVESQGLVFHFWKHITHLIKEPVENHIASVLKKFPSSRRFYQTKPVKLNMTDMFNKLRQVPLYKDPAKKQTSASTDNVSAIRYSSDNNDKLDILSDKCGEFWYPPSCLRINENETRILSYFLARVASISKVAHDVVFHAVHNLYQKVRGTRNINLHKVLKDNVKDMTLTFEKHSDPDGFSHLFESPKVMKVPGKVLMAVNNLLNHEVRFIRLDGLSLQFLEHFKGIMKDPINDFITRNFGKQLKARTGRYKTPTAMLHIDAICTQLSAFSAAETSASDSEPENNESDNESLVNSVPPPVLVSPAPSRKVPEEGGRSKDELSAGEALIALSLGCSPS